MTLGEVTDTRAYAGCVNAVQRSTSQVCSLNLSATTG